MAAYAGSEVCTKLVYNEIRSTTVIVYRKAAQMARQRPSGPPPRVASRMPPRMHMQHPLYRRYSALPPAPIRYGPPQPYYPDADSYGPPGEYMGQYDDPYYREGWGEEEWQQGEWSMNESGYGVEGMPPDKDQILVVVSFLVMKL